MTRQSLEFWIASDNVVRFRELLKCPADEGQREVVEYLLARELVKLGIKAPG